MNKAIEIFGNHIYSLAGKNPVRTRRHLSAVYDISGLICKYFPDKGLLSSRQYLQWVTTDTVMKALKKGEGSAIINLFLPCEILHSMGINLMFPESYACYLAAAGSGKYFLETAASNGVPGTMCSYHKSFIGFMESGVMPRPELVINTTLACDANHLTFRRAAEFYDVPHYVIDVPTEYNEKNVSYVADSLKQMISFIEENTSFKLDEKKFEEAINFSKKTLKNIRESIELHATRSYPDEMNSYILDFVASHTLLGLENNYLYSQKYINELKQIPEGLKGTRLFWMHTLPYWQDALKPLVDRNENCEIIACELALDTMDVNLDEPDPFRYMAERLLKSSINGTGNRRIENAFELAKKMNADGVIMYCPWGCKQAAGISSVLKSYMEEKGMPVLVLEGDGCDASNVNDGQTLTRMEAFLEVLKNDRL